MRKIYKFSILTAFVLAALVPRFLCYTPSSNVQAAHRIPHRFHLGDEGLTIREYLISVAEFPIIIAGLGILSVVIFQLIMCCRWCCKRCCLISYMKICKCREQSLAMNFPIDVVREEKKNIIATVFFVVFVVFVLISDFCVFKGHNLLIKSMNIFGDSLVLLGNIFEAISAAAALMSSTASSVSTTITKSCSFLPAGTTSSLSSSTQLFSSAANDISSTTGNLPNTFHNLRDIIVGRGVSSINTVVYVYFAVIMFFVILFGVARFFKSRWTMLPTVILTEIVVVTLTLIACFEMVLITIASDICMDPAGLILKLVPSTGSLHDILVYYLYCNSVSPFTNSVNSATRAFTSFNATVISQVLGHGYGNSTFGACASGLTGASAKMLQGVQTVVTQVQCPPLFGVFNTAINESFCTLAFSGEFTIWLTHFITAACLYFVLMTTIYLYDSFDPEYQMAMHPLEAHKETAAVDGYGGAAGGGTPAGMVPVYDGYGGVEMRPYAPVEVAESEPAEAGGPAPKPGGTPATLVTERYMTVV